MPRTPFALFVLAVVPCTIQTLLAFVLVALAFRSVAPAGIAIPVRSDAPVCA